MLEVYKESTATARAFGALVSVFPRSQPKSLLDLVNSITGDIRRVSQDMIKDGWYVEV